jgi:glycosyltransferase involved in cell wall biosynthesis
MDDLMKKIVFVTRSMILGGIEKALISLLESIPKGKYEITVLVMGSGGELEEEIPSEVEVRCLNGDEKTIIEKIKKRLIKGEFYEATRICWYTLLAKKSKSVFQQEMYNSKLLPILKTDYDLAVAYHVPASFPVVYVMDNLKAKKRVAWIHSDVSHYKDKLQRYKNYYQNYDMIYCVSKNALIQFNELFPDLAEKTLVFYNMVNKSKIHLMSNKDEGFDDEFTGTRILTIGRMTEEKGQYIIPTILRKLLSEGFNVKWYCIGDGASRQLIEKLIKKYNLEEYLILLGDKKNPYPYLKQCDIYVQTSLHEGYCITLAEARAFNKPIISTNFAAAKEQIIDEETGIIVEFDEQEIFRQLVNMLSNPKLITKLKNNLASRDKENNSDIKLLLNLV